ncbi:MAG: CHASE2 domain-containing protein [Geobacteraceae bacterium]|nr:CHASE2 domain-containing protein [Geobacteraceae bacterium]NTW81349.1 CHASE2 domain-containing protein [Geobacteraceae bacterium]
MKLPTPFGLMKTLTKSILLLGLAVSSVIIAAYLVHPAFINTINNKTTDAVMAFSPSNPATSSVEIVDIDEKSLATYGQWPWPRFRLASLLQKVSESGAASISLDILLAEPDRTSPSNWQSTIGSELGYHIDISKVPANARDHDRYLADTLALGTFILGYEFLFGDVTHVAQACRLHPLNVVWMNNSDAMQAQADIYKAHNVVCNLPMFSNAVPNSGFLNAVPDPDGVLRRVPLLIQFKDRLYPSFALATLMQSKKSTQVHIVQNKNGILDLVVDKAAIPIDKLGNMRINFSRRTGAAQRISAGDILEGLVPPDGLKGKIVLIGSSAAGLTQMYQTPGQPVCTHVGVHAQILENMVSGQFVIRPQEFLVWEAILGLIITVMLCFSIVKMGIVGSAATGVASLLGMWVGMGAIFQANGYLFSPLLPSVLILLNYAILTIYKTRQKHREATVLVEDSLLLLRCGEQNLNSIIKTVPDIIFRLDGAGRITFISPAITKYTDHPDQLLGQPVFNLVVPDDLQKAQYRLNEKRTGERATHSLEIRLLLAPKQDGTTDSSGYFSVSAEGIYNSDNHGTIEFIGTQGIIRDISEQKKLENRLMHAQKMEAIGNLAAGVAHDLNNILTGLVSYPDLLLLELPKDSPLRKRVLAIQQSGQKAAAIVQDLLTFARRGVAISEVVNVNAIIAEYLAAPEYIDSQKAHPNISVLTDFSAELMNIKGSKVHLSKVIMNTFNNAAEAMPSGGSIRISTFNKYLDVPLNAYEEIPEGEYVCFRIVDEGVGIGPDDIKKIFEPFYTNKSMKRSGSGLGMTIIWATIKDHAGFIDIQSKEGEGTQFTMYLPATREISDNNGHKMVLEDYLGKENILIVDDIPEQIEIASKMLTKLGYTVFSARSGEAAVDFMEKQGADLIVLDMIMPGGIDGLETYKRIISIHPNQKAIIASGYSETERVKMLRELGVETYIQKPYTLEKIGIAVRMELDR